jgi:uncharacterized protein
MRQSGLGRRVVGGAIACLFAASAAPAVAQSFDCTKAQDKVDRAICASAALRQADSDMATAFAAAVARDPAQADAQKAAQRAWIKIRNACVSGAGASAESCIARAYADRIAALAPPAAPSPAATQAAAPAPQPAAPPAAAPAVTLQPAGIPAPPPAAASLESAQVPSAGAHDVLLRVTAPGRFAIRAESATGTALQLVDMLTGPGERAGLAGKNDGRIDALLDVGTYKLRAFGAKDAAGDTKLSVTPFAGNGPALLAPGYAPATLALTDLHQQSFWLVVGEGEASTRIEAAGRSLGALKLWRDGRDLAPLVEQRQGIAPLPVHPLSDIVLEGKLPPGSYLVTAYGGPALPWADGATDQPLSLRTGRSDDVRAGGATGSVGPFGSEVFAVAPDATQALLVLPQPAAASLRVRAGTEETDRVEILRTQRPPANLLALPDKTDVERSIELAANPGTAFVLRGTPAPASMPTKPGEYVFAAAQYAQGGDEAPAGAVLARIRKDGTGDILAAAGVPSVGPNAAWRAKFNLRGRTTLLFRATAPVTLAVQADGPPVEPVITTLQGAVMNATGNGRAATRWAVSPGVYFLVLTQKKPAAGILDLTLGPAGVIPPAPEPPGPPGPVLSLGTQTVDTTSTLRLFTNSVPDSVGGLVARAVPVGIDAGPLVLTLAKGESRALPLHAAHAGTLVLRDIAGGAAIDSQPVEDDTDTSLTLPTPDRARTFAIAWLPPRAEAKPEPEPAPDLRALRDDAPVFLDLKRDEQASFALDVAQGGLLDVTTLGRLRTEGRIGTSFLPDLDRAKANGVGQNMLIQRYLRAGRYRLDVTARDSAGHLGVVAAPANLAEGTTLLPGLSVRASLPEGTGVAFPIRIDRDGRYRLDLLGPDRSFTARLEDAEGWPLLPTGNLSTLQQEFSAGTYRLIVQPPATAARAVARLARIETPPPIEGHGPRALPFDAAQAATWREPASREAPRTPDAWTFDLAGPAKVYVELRGDGMAATLRGADAATPLARLLPGVHAQELPAGRYIIEASALGRNDRLDYSLKLRSDELQPGAPRTVYLSKPGTQSFALAAPRVVSLTTFGAVPLRATLRAEDGGVVARAVGRTDDWNIAISRLLPAGRYTLDLAALPAPAKPPAEEASQEPNQEQSSSDQSSSDQSGESSDQSQDQQQDQSGGDQGMQPAMNDDQSPPDQSSSGQQNADQPAADQGNANAEQADNSNGDEEAPPKEERPHTELTLALPVDLPDAALSADGAAALSGAGVHHVPLPAATPDALLVAGAEAPAEVILAVETRGADGAWRVLTQAQGRAPLLALPGDGTAWRASVWAVDGGDLPIRLAARAVTQTAQAIGEVHLTPLDLPGLTALPGAASLDDPGAGLLSVTGNGVRAASAPGVPSEPPSGRLVVARSTKVWLLARGDHLDVAAVAAPQDQTLALTVPEGARAVLPLPARTPGHVCAAVAASGLGQPGLDSGRGMGVAPGTTFALCGDAPMTAWNAGGADALRLTLRGYNLPLAEVQPVDLAYVATLPPRTAQPVRLPAGSKRLEASLPAGVALVAGPVTAWAGDAPLTRSLDGAWTEALLLNTTDNPAPVALTAVPAPEAPPLAPGAVLRRFFGAAGSFALPLAAKPGQHLHVAGDASATVLRGDGQVRSGADLSLDGPASAVVTHGPGALALWLEGDGVSPWPKADARDTTLPARVTLSGEAMALRVTPPGPALLRLRTTAPAILALGDAPPRLFGQGVTLDRPVSGETVLRLLSPSDGPLSGTLDLAATPIAEIAEGVGAPVAVAPGGSAVFAFRVTAEGPVGLGVRADPDRVAARLLDASGQEIDHGVTLLRTLKPGRYLLEASVPPDAPTTVLRPAVLGTAPHPTPPPPDLVRNLLIEAGFAPPDAGDTP